MAEAFTFTNDSGQGRGVGSTVASESALRSARILLSRVRAPPLAPWPDGGPESLRSRCCGLAIYKKTRTGLSCPLQTRTSVTGLELTTEESLQSQGGFAEIPPEIGLVAGFLKNCSERKRAKFAANLSSPVSYKRFER
ncbi:hypothetical protein PoB_003749100 [Plakobranchus ocellatus]|uniref:Uncharacterized protein n=1 Tax=Plakobranchus ocellatus TaxID=259542 RepID=A0AAV4AS39_9GAST|nr:hypothetical protein PoB_003749100 [Plakobranchus ocellatus]